MPKLEDDRQAVLTVPIGRAPGVPLASASLARQAEVIGDFLAACRGAMVDRKDGRRLRARELSQA